MTYFRSIFDFYLLPILALYCGYLLWGVVGFLIVGVYVTSSLFYIFLRKKKDSKEEKKFEYEMSRKELHTKTRGELVYERVTASLFVYLHLVPLSVLVIVTL